MLTLWHVSHSLPSCHGMASISRGVIYFKGVGLPHCYTQQVTTFWQLLSMYSARALITASKYTFSLLRPSTTASTKPGFLRLLCSSSTGAARMANKVHVNIDITSDVVCPWCWIGKRSLDTAINHLKDDFEFHIHWKPFLLNPAMPEEGIPAMDYFRLKFGEEAAQRFMSGNSPVSQRGRELGLNFNPNRLVVATKKPHIMIDFAGKHRKQHEMQEVLFRAYFADGRNVASNEVLKELVEEVGLDGDHALAALSDTEYVGEFEKGVKEAYAKGITGVPFFEISLKDNPNITQQFSGGQPVDTFVKVFGRLKTMAKV